MSDSITDVRRGKLPTWRFCPTCNYIGPAHLCGCMGRLGEAIRAGDCERAAAIFDGIVAEANRFLREGTVWE